MTTTQANKQTAAERLLAELTAARAELDAMIHDVETGARADYASNHHNYGFDTLVLSYNTDLELAAKNA